jgi:hypothetical protein
VARKWTKSIPGTSHLYELIRVQFRSLFMLLRDEIRHNQKTSGINQAQSCWLTLTHVGSGRAQGELRSAQECSATAQAVYSLLTLYPCVTQFLTQFQIQKELCMRVDFTLLLSALSEQPGSCPPGVPCVACVADKCKLCSNMPLKRQK